LGSLTAHLLEEGDHGRLGFHPRCPVCRGERLFGSLPTEPVVSRRLKAALATGALVFPAVAPGVTIAGEPDRQQEGLAAPEQSVDLAPEQQPSEGAADDPVFDPGGETALPLETGTPEATSPDDPSADYAAPVEPAEPVHDPYAGGLLPTEPEPEARVENAPAPPGEAVPLESAPPNPDTPVVESPPMDPATPAPEPPNTEDAPADPGSSNPRTGDKGNQRSGRDRSRPREERTGPTELTAPAPQVPTNDVTPALGVTPAAGVTPTAPPSTSSNAAASSSPSVLVEASTSTGRPPRKSSDTRFHIVKPGESLWSIAKRLLGPTATPAEIAREVNRLWELNKESIGTGNPDLLIAGAKLRLH
jgi:hypothetical protein